MTHAIYVSQSTVNTGDINLRRYERLLLISFILASCYYLWLQWGQYIGYDTPFYLAVFERVHWFQPLPTSHDISYAYHPPLPYLLQRIIYQLIPNAITSAQLLSWLCVTTGLLLLRASLKHMGVLWSIAGICFFYGAVSLPLVIFLSMSITNDSLLFLATLTILYASVKLFWHSPSAMLTRHRFWVWLVFVLAIAAGLMTKFTALLLFVIPPLVVIIRCRGKRLLTSLLAVFIASLLAVLVVSPFYYLHYMRNPQQSAHFPMDSSDWGEVYQNENIRHKHPWQFLGYIMRIPGKGRWDKNDPTRDSFFHSIWLQTWKRDQKIGPQSPLSNAFSDTYAIVFIPLTIVGTLLFLFNIGSSSQAWRHLGWLMLGLLLLFALAQIYFAWMHPAWRYRPIKAKYMVVGLLWLPFCAAQVVSSILEGCRSFTVLQPMLCRCVVAAIFGFLLINHVLPVY